MSDNSKDRDNNFQNINLQHAKESLKLTLDQALFNIGTKTAIYTQQDKFIVSIYNPVQAVHAFVFKEQCDLPDTESYTFLYLEFFTAQVHEITMNFEYTDDSRPSVEQLITAAKLLYNKTKQEMQQEQPSTDPEHIANELLNKLRLH